MLRFQVLALARLLPRYICSAAGRRAAEMGLSGPRPRPLIRRPDEQCHVTGAEPRILFIARRVAAIFPFSFLLFKTFDKTTNRMKLGQRCADFARLRCCWRL